MDRAETLNVMTKEQIDAYIKQIYEAAIIYRKFEDNLNIPGEHGNSEKEDKIYMITKTFLDNFKNKIKYNETRDLYVDEKNEENFKKFEENLKYYKLDELELIIFGELNLYGDLEKINDDYEKGFDFVNADFLEKLEFEIEKDMQDSNVKYYKENNNVIVIFTDNSKLLISEKEGKYKYNAIPSPIKSNTIQKKRTFQFNNLNKAKTIREN